MKSKNNQPIAILVDGDNASPDKLNEVIRFVSKFGNPIIKRIYADWTKSCMGKWKESANEHSFRLIEAPSYVSGKNTTDIALIMDAMDILHSDSVKAFCIVSSDSDYTLLAQRIREDGLTVIGYGESKTPKSLVNTCCEFMISNQVKEEPLNTPEFFISRDTPIFHHAFEEAADGKEEVSLSLVGTALKKLMPKYKIKRYGCKTLGALYAQLDRYELVKTGKKEIGNMLRVKAQEL